MPQGEEEYLHQYHPLRLVLLNQAAEMVVLMLGEVMLVMEQQEGFHRLVACSRVGRV